MQLVDVGRQPVGQGRRNLVGQLVADGLDLLGLGLDFGGGQHHPQGRIVQDPQGRGAVDASQDVHGVEVGQVLADGEGQLAVGLLLEHVAADDDYRRHGVLNADAEGLLRDVDLGGLHSEGRGSIAEGAGEQGPLFQIQLVLLFQAQVLEFLATHALAQDLVEDLEDLAQGDALGLGQDALHPHRVVHGPLGSGQAHGAVFFVEGQFFGAGLA